MSDKVVASARLYREGKTAEARALIEERLREVPDDRAALALLDDIIRDMVHRESERERQRNQMPPARVPLFSCMGCLLVGFVIIVILMGIGVALFPRLIDYFFNCIVRGFLGDGSGCH